MSKDIKMKLNEPMWQTAKNSAYIYIFNEKYLPFNGENNFRFCAGAQRKREKEKWPGLS